jgi:hypothetical protein
MRRGSSPRPSARARGDAPIAPDRVNDRSRAVLDGSLRAVLRVEFKRERREVVDYSVVLLVEHEDELRVVRLYDGAHGSNELHRHALTRGKQPAERFHLGTLEWECEMPSGKSERATRR